MSPLAYRPELDGLRALAVLAVIFFHFNPGWLPGGFLGVDIFFVLSGYLMGAIAIKESSAGYFSLRGFIERRLRRILPALFFICSLCFIPAWLLLPPSDMTDFSESILANTLAVTNYLFLSEAGYFDRASDMKPLLHTWSLAVEIQFYGLFVLVIWAWRRWRWPVPSLPELLRKLLMVMAVGYGCYLLIYGLSADVSFYSFPSRLWEFAAGVATAAARTRQLKIPSGGVVLALLVLLATLAGVAGISEWIPLATGIAVLATAALILGADSDSPVARLLSLKPMVWLGMISYSLYLIHNPVLSFGRYAEVAGKGAFALITLPTMVLLAYLSWRWVENPFRNRRVVSTRGFKIFCTASTAAALLVFGFCKESDGFLRLRLSDQQQQMLATATREKRAPWCQTGGDHFRSPADACVLNGENPRWAVFGDSHAGAVASALADAIRAETGSATQWLSMRGCPPTFDPNSSAACARWTRESIDALAANPDIGHVVVVYRLNAYFHGSFVYDRMGISQYISGETRDGYWQAYAEIVQALVDAGKQVTLISPIPEPTYHIADLIFKRGDYGEDLVAAPRSMWDSRNAFARAGISKLQQVKVFDPTPLFCNQRDCFGVRHRVAIYYDHNHLSEYGAQLFARAFVKQML